MGQTGPWCALVSPVEGVVGRVGRGGIRSIVGLVSLQVEFLLVGSDGRAKHSPELWGWE